MTEAPQDPYAAGQYPGGPAGPYPGGQAATAGYGPYPGAGQPGAGAYPPPYGYGYPAQMGTNTLAILALVFAFIFAPAAIVLGIVARKQIRGTGEQGMGLATAGMVCGIVFSVLMVVWIGIMIALLATVNHQISNDQDSTGAVLYAARAYFGF